GGAEQILERGSLHARVELRVPEQLPKRGHVADRGGEVTKLLTNLRQATLVLRGLVERTRIRAMDERHARLDLLPLEDGEVEPGAGVGLAVLLEQLPRVPAGTVCLLARLPDALPPLVDQLLDRAEGIALEDEERDREADQGPDHQPRGDPDQR